MNRQPFRIVDAKPGLSVACWRGGALVSLRLQG
jgi:hypothetical protein